MVESKTSTSKKKKRNVEGKLQIKEEKKKQRKEREEISISKARDEDLAKSDREAMMSEDLITINTSLVDIWGKKVSEADRLVKENIIHDFHIPDERGIRELDKKDDLKPIQLPNAILNPTKTGQQSLHLFDIITKLQSIGAIGRSHRIKKSELIRLYIDLVDPNFSSSDLIEKKEAPIFQSIDHEGITINDLNDQEEGYPLRIETTDGVVNITTGVARGIIAEAFRQRMINDERERINSIESEEDLKKNYNGTNEIGDETKCGKWNHPLIIGRTNQLRIC